MSKETEKVFKAFDEYMKMNGEPESEDELKEMLDAFMQDYNSRIPNMEPLTAANAKTSDDYMELAEQATSVDEALRFAKKALKVDPDNLDAETYVAVLGARDFFDQLKKIEKAVTHGNKLMEEQGYFDEEYIGEIWTVHQTRPYMRLRRTYVDCLEELCMFDAAAVECEELLRLCDGDNIGARYTLMHLYAMQGNEEKALSLLDRYSEYGAMMLLPLALLYYKRNDLENARKHLKVILKHNPDTKKFLKIAADRGDLIPEDFNPSMYRPYTIDELYMTVFEHDWLYMPNDMFFIWANEELNNKGKTEQKKIRQRRKSRKSD